MNVRCRSEMYDRDVVLLQIGAALMESNEYLIHILNKFGLIRWCREDYDLSSKKVLSFIVHFIEFNYWCFIYIMIFL